MNASIRRAWVPAALLVGVAYFIIGRGFTLPTEHVHAWRLAAWAFSLVAFGAHIWYEHFRQRSAPRSTAFHAAVAVAIGAIGLALAGMIHSLSAGAALRPAWLLALVLWPAITAIPAFLVALTVAAVLERRHSI